MPLALVYLIPGLLLLFFVILDILWTTISVEGGAGPLSSRVMVAPWKLLRSIVGDGSRMLVLAGPLALGLTMAAWIAGLWAGWTLVFAGAERTIVDTASPDPISWWDRAYFAGYTIFTLGNGDFAPIEGPWQIATTLATASGMLVITLTVSYVLSVLNAVTQKRSFASSVTAWGTRGEGILTTGWNGEAFAGLEGSLRAFTSKLNTLTANHKAYPVLHYFHSHEPEQAPATAIAALDESLTLLLFGIEDGIGPAPAIVQSARAGVTNYLSTLAGSFVRPADEQPHPPDLDGLRRAGIPVVPEEDFVDSIADLAERRRTLLGLVRSDTRDWPGET